ncbi:MAG: leucyl/phenylalanyl-tRNA--protein transferase [Gammaproteobacteria bacterium]|nr:MAG: leucyl/phenylalanyl-tRNA--protein transferase [Gammaproteobacteria bacterium]
MLDGSPPGQPFPDPATAETAPDGLLAMGGDLTLPRLVSAYRQGIFPWYSQGQPILWWSPDPRMVLFPEELHLSRSLRKELRKRRFEITFDRNFEAVIRACAAPRHPGEGAWLTHEMILAYETLHERGMAHSVEAWQEGQLVGGLYGVQQGSLFFGESMFSRVSNASKVAFVHLVRSLQQHGCPLIDCQVYTPHLESLGATLIPRTRFLELVKRHIDDSFSFPEAPCSVSA